MLCVCGESEYVGYGSGGSDATLHIDTGTMPFIKAIGREREEESMDIHKMLD